MFKFFRKYNKYILAVGGTLLLIMFLINVPFESLIGGMGGARTAWATVGPDHEKVTEGDLRHLQRELQLLQFLRGQLNTPDKFDRPEYWYLLTREAEEAGLIGAATPSTVSLPQDNITALCAASGEPEAFVLETVARFDGVRRLMQMSLGGSRWSDRRLKHAAQRTFLRATVQPVVIEAKAGDVSQHFSDDDLKAQLDKYASVSPGEGAMGFGYRLPDRAKLEWLAIPAAGVKAMLERSGKLDPVALRKYWRQHADQFGPPQADADVPDNLREVYLAEQVQKTLEEIAKDAADQLRFDRRGLAQRAGYFEIPPGWQGLSFQDLALKLQSTYGIDLPAYEARGDAWLTEADLAALPGIGPATSDKFGDRAVGLAELVMDARELRGSQTIPMQVGIAGPVLRGPDHGVYLFRITAADASRPPKDVDEVREQLTRDLAKLNAYKALAASAPELRSAAAAEGLLALAIANGTQVGRTTVVSLSSPATSNIPGLGPSKEAAEAIIDQAITLPLDKPLADLPALDTVIAVPVEARLSVLVAKIIDRTLVTEESFRSYADRGTVQAQLLTAEVTDDTSVWDAFKYESLAGRHGFKLVRGGEEASKPDAPPAKASSTGG